MAAQSPVLYVLHAVCKEVEWTNDSALSVEIVMRQRFQKLYENMDGVILVIDDRYAPDSTRALFNVPSDVLVLPLLGEHYFWNQLSGLIDDPLQRKHWAHRLASFTSSKFDIAHRNGMNFGIEIVAEFEVTTFELVDEDTVIDHIQYSSLESSAGDCGRKGASKSVIEGLKKEMVKSGDVEGTCVVCLEELSVGAELTRMACSHAFHHACLIQWFQESNNCPVCRYVLPDSLE